jgi:hypothetical protein
VDRGHLGRLVVAERREDPRHPPREHRLAPSGRSDHEEVVSPRRGDLERALGLDLPANVREVEGRLRGGDEGVDGRLLAWILVGLAAERAERRDGLDGDSRHGARLGRVHTREPDRSAPLAPRRREDCERPPHAAKRTVERQLADEHALFDRRAARDLSGGEQDRHCDG